MTTDDLQATPAPPDTKSWFEYAWKLEVNKEAFHDKTIYKSIYGLTDENLE